MHNLHDEISITINSEKDIGGGGSAEYPPPPTIENYRYLLLIDFKGTLHSYNHIWNDELDPLDNKFWKKIRFSLPSLALKIV